MGKKDPRVKSGIGSTSGNGEFDDKLEEVTEPLFKRLTAAIRPGGPKGNSPAREGGEQ
jgi:hypothetical protein